MEELLLKVEQAFIYLFVAAVIQERSLSLIFNWRIYKEKLEGRGFKVPISFFFSILLVATTQLDIVSFIFESPKSFVHFVGYPLTAMIVAQGSAMVSSTWGDMKKGGKP